VGRGPPSCRFSAAEETFTIGKAGQWAGGGVCPAWAESNHGAPIASLSFFPDGNTLISAGQDSLVKFWTIPAGALFRSVATDSVPVQVAVSPEGKWITVAMSGGLLEIWSTDGTTRRSLVGHTGTVNGVAFTADGSKLVSVSQDHTTRIWSVADAKLLRTFADADAMNEVAVPAADRVMARAPGLRSGCNGASQQNSQEGHRNSATHAGFLRPESNKACKAQDSLKPT